VVSADFLSWRLPTTPHVIVGNLPFHVTTATLRKLLHVGGWSQAVLLVQWEVARRRAGVGGASMMTAQWWPWIDFSLEGRVHRSAFRPAPNVDGGLLVMAPRARPLVAAAHRKPYRQFVHDVFTAKGRGLVAMLADASGMSCRLVQRWIADAGVPATLLPKDLSAEQWAQLFRLRPTGFRSRNGISGH
jgi:23S rRNA (adenine-N6)-dimethyltransferase